MRSLLLFLLPTFVGCGATWGLRDEDGDGKSILDGDCWDAPDGGADIGPDAAEIWYDGIDQNCDGLSDFDQDGDGFDALGSGEGTDCWDDPTVTPTGFSAINGFDALTAADVYDGAADRWYDGIDANCDGMSDFDQDGDGFDTENADYGPPDGSGTDCYDGADVDDYPGDGTETTLLDPADVYPREETDETWYDGTDGNCDEWDDYDQDRDGYPLDEECNDLDPLIFPDETVEEIWYNDVDENCDGNLYDKDGDGFESALYGGTDCWDDPEDMPADFEVMHGRTQPAANQVYPGNEDDTWYDGVDADCAGNSDFDQDLDGYDTDELENRAGVTGTDCEDEDSEAYPGASEIWYNDVDNDCLGGSDYDADGDGFDYDAEISTGTDCDDARPEVNTDANEACGTTYDDNCDGDLDLLDATDCITWNYDGDGDTYGTASTECWCEAQTATNFDASNDDDCDDASASDYPGATESVANGDDEDCDGGDTCYVDGDSDGYRNEDTTLTVDSTDLDCNDSGEGASTELATDCNDSNAGVSPGDAEIVADGIDQDCDDGDTCYVDADSDGYRSETTTLTVTSVDLDCTDSGEGASTEPATDCNDSDATVSPADSEVVADSIDQDCDDVDSCYTDADGDNYGTTVVVDGSSLNCSSGTGAPVSTDCDDSDADTFPGSAASELTTSCTNDDDGDGYGDSTVSALYVEGTDCNDASSSISPAASDTVADGIDQDCDNVD
ncbi:MAG: MopE-related protein, partial [Acidimicrobiia bacterium]